MANLKIATVLALSTLVLMFGGNAGAAEKDSGSREPANVVVPVPETTGARSATRESDKEAPVAPTDTEDNDHLTGNWGGVRSLLSGKGVDLGLVYKQEFGRVAGGGAQLGNFSLGNFDIRLSLDTEKMGFWKGGSFFFYGLFNDGANPTEFVGDEQGTSNIETADWTGRLYEAWFQQSFLDGKASVLVGVHDLNSEFYVTDTSGIFLNSSFGVGRELSQTGAAGPSVFPVAAPALRVRVAPTENYYVQAAAFNGVAGDPNYPMGTHLRFGPKDDGLLYIGEAGWLRTKPAAEEGKDPEVLGKVAFGTWAYKNGEIYVAAGDDKAPAGSYVLVDQALTDNIAVFFRGGFSNHKGLTVASDLSAGVAFKGLIPTRDDDLLGFAMTSVSAGADAKDEGAEPSETTYEVTYRAKVYRGVVVQPDYQYVNMPSFDKSTPWAHVLGARLELNF